MIFFILFAAILSVQVSQPSVKNDNSYPGWKRAQDIREMNRGKR